MNRSNQTRTSLESGDAGERAFYAMVQSGPAVDPDEVEVAHASAVEVMIFWGSNVLHVSHLAPPRSFHVGEESGPDALCDYFIPGESLGARRAPIVLWRDGQTVLVILPQSHGFLDVPGHGLVGLADLVSAGRARPSTEMHGAYEIELPAGAKARMQIAGSALAFQVSTVKAGKKVAGGLLSTMEPAAFWLTGLSFALHLGLVGAFAFFMPTLRGDDAEGIDRDRVLAMQRLLNAAAEREQEERRDPAPESALDRSEGGTGAAATGESGTLGDPNTRETGHKYAVQGPRDNPDPHLAQKAALQEAAQFGIIGLIATMGGGDPNAPTTPWGREASSGRDDRSALGNMFGDGIGNAFGADGLGLSGVGEGGGGRAQSIGLSEFGLPGHGAGGCESGPCSGIGHGLGIGGRGHPVRAPRLIDGNSEVHGRIPAEVIQRIVRQNFGRFRLCYENGMRGNPGLAGRVSVKFVIDRGGAVSMTADGGSDLPDPAVVQCVVRGFANLSFPQPEGGMVTVVYPIMFNPGD